MTTPGSPGRAVVVLGRGLEPLDQLEGREELEDPRGELGVSRGVFGGGGALAAAAAAQVLLGEFVDRVELRGACVAVHGPSVGGASRRE